MAKFVYLPQLKKAINLDCIKEVTFYETDNRKCVVVFVNDVSGYIEIKVDSIEIGEKIMKQILALTEGLTVESEAPAPPASFDVGFL